MKKVYYFGLLICISIMGCDEEKMGPFISDGTIPALISNISTESLPGGATITYHVPDDPNLLYVEAEYIASNGKLSNIRASHYTNSLTIEGLGSTDEKEVKVYSVGRNERRSEPIVTSIHPLTPPVHEVYESLEIVEDFGGITIDFVNRHEASVAIIVTTRDELGDEIPADDIYYTSQESGKFSIRGYPDQPREFSIQIRDKWDNFSEKTTGTFTPLYEVELDKSRFREVKLPTDALQYSNVPMSNLWSNSLVGGSSASNRGTAWYRTANGSGIPHHFTFELGVTAKLSRYIQHQRGVVSEASLVYSAGNPRYWEVWGATDPSPDGSWEGWTKLIDGTSIKPSGLPLNEMSDEDAAYALAGEEFYFPSDAPPVRYIRIRILGTWGLSDYMHIGELTFFGDVVK